MKTFRHLSLKRFNINIIRFLTPTARFFLGSVCINTYSVRSAFVFDFVEKKKGKLGISESRLVFKWRKTSTEPKTKRSITKMIDLPLCLEGLTSAEDVSRSSFCLGYTTHEVRKLLFPER